jgi:NADP-dependent 3-hydroxy acid dehydrogenase YdfG
VPDAQPTPSVAVVAGASGLVGGAVARRLAAAGWRVVAPVRGAAGPDALAGLPGVRVVPGVDWARPDALRATLAEPGWAPRAAVVALGGWWVGPELVDLDVATWSALLGSHLTSHWLAARALAPLLTGPDPVYVALAGAAATEPMPGSGPVNVTGAGQRMLLAVLRAESIGARVRFHEVAVMAAVAGDDRNVDPVASVPLDVVSAAVERVLGDPTSASVVEVAGA